MFFADKPLPPPPPIPKPRNESLAASMSSYRARPTPSSKVTSINFNSARALFDAAKQPEVRNAITSVAKNPAIRSAAISVAKNEQARSAVVEAAKDDRSRNTILNLAKLYDSQSSKIVTNSQGYDHSNTTTTSSSDSQAHTPLTPFAPSVKSTTKPTSGFSSLLDEPSFTLSKPQAQAQTHSFESSPFSSSSFSSSTTSSSSTTTTNAERRKSLWDPLSSITKFSSIHDELASLNLFHTPQKKVPPARPPPPKTKSVTAPSSPTNEPYAIVKYPYKATQFDELSCQPNDVVILKKEVDDQWIYALNTRSGEHGIVPIVFLHIKVPLVPTQTSNLVSRAISSIQRRDTTTARALYDYDTGVDGDLKFHANDIINVIEKVNDDWLRGEIGSMQGIFPINFVQLLGPLPSSQSSSQKFSSQLSAAKLATPKPVSAKETVVAAYDYNSGVADDLVFRQGDVIEVVERISSDWIRGRLNGSTGLVPCTYIIDSNSNKTTNAASSSNSCPRIVHAIQDYFNVSSNHLCFSKGDEIEVTEEVDNEWLKGKLLLNMANTKSFPCGVFPRSAVQ